MFIFYYFFLDTSRKKSCEVYLSIRKSTGENEEHATYEEKAQLSSEKTQLSNTKRQLFYREDRSEKEKT